MDLDDDLFADKSGPAVNPVRGRFQPKAKPRPRKGPTAPADRQDRLLDPVGSSVPISEVDRTVVQLRENESSETTRHSEVTDSGVWGDLQYCFQKAVGQNADVLSGSMSPNDFPSQPAYRPQMSALISSGYDRSEGVAVEGQSSNNNAAPGACDLSQSQTCADLFVTQDPVSSGQSTLTNYVGGIPVRDARLEREVQQEEAFPDLNCQDFTSEEAVASGGRVGKYKPRPQVRIESKECDIRGFHPDAVEFIMHSPHAQFVSSGAQFLPEDSIPASAPEDCFDYSSIDLDDVTPLDPTSSEFQVNEDLTNFADTYRSDTPFSGNVQYDFFTSTENQSAIGDKSLSPLRKGVAGPEHVHDPDNEAHNDERFTAEPPCNAVDEGEGGVNGTRAEKTATKKIPPRKSSNPATENGKTVQKRKKANKASDNSVKEPPKKFSHSTRRKRRIVSKELLETPEDEIDPQKVPLKDLILLAEYKERLAVKEAKAAGAPVTNQCVGQSSRDEDYHDEDETFASEQGNGSFGDPPTERLQPRVQYFNYQSFMKKTPTVRWSKQETELFYEAIRQFGTDLSMIQQLFPGRTRQQVKLKYKKEEREHPFRLTDALTNRSNDHSHFEKVIKQLQQVSAQAAQDAKQDDSAGMTDEEVEEELNPKHTEKAEAVEQDQNGEGGVDEVHSPVKADENDDDDDDIWNSYNSEF